MDAKEDNSSLVSSDESRTVIADGSTVLQTVQQLPLGVGTIQRVHVLQTHDGTVLTTDSLEALNGVVLTLAPEGEAVTLQPQQLCGKLVQVIPSENSEGLSQILQINSDQPFSTKSDDLSVKNVKEEPIESHSEGHDVVAQLLLLPQPSIWPTPPDAPTWALRMRDCELIGDSYRGWVASEVELDLLLTYHKQQTHSIWGTRQSTGSHRNSLRLMWKSQYVPFDGIPFINAGSRAVVMECQYGPRRKGSPWGKSEGLQKGEFKQTCPARIYVKKVRKFPEFKVDLKMDKKSLRAAMEKAFLDLRTSGYEGHGEDRWYVQLPRESAHEFHDGPASSSHASVSKKAAPKQQAISEVKQKDSRTSSGLKRLSRIHPQLVEHIRELVSHGMVGVFSIRKQLRKFVEKEMFSTPEEVPERHNLCFFPTIHDIQNHVYEALKDIREGTLPLLAPSVNIEVQSQNIGMLSSNNVNETTREGIQGSWDTNLISADSEPQLHTITVTLTRSADPTQAPVISKIETHLSDGSIRTSNTLTPETFELLSRLHPAVFPAGSLENLVQMSESQSCAPESASLTNVTHNCSEGGSHIIHQTQDIIPPENEVHQEHSVQDVKNDCNLQELSAVCEEQMNTEDTKT